MSPLGTGHEMRADFHQALDDVDDAFVEAALIVGESLPRLTRRFLAADHGSIDEARQIATDVDQRCLEVQEQAFILLAKEGPVSGDLRRIVALLRLVHDVERSASLMAHVCETLERFNPRELAAPLQDMVAELADRAADVFRAGIDAWRQRDGLAVSKVDAMDERVDRLQEVLMEEASRRQDTGGETLVLGLLARYFERIADHGVAFAQDAAFVATGDRVALAPRGETVSREDR